MRIKIRILTVIHSQFEIVIKELFCILLRCTIIHSEKEKRRDCTNKSVKCDIMCFELILKKRERERGGKVVIFSVYISMQKKVNEKNNFGSYHTRPCIPA
jgi:hypothetical protein